MVNWAFAILFPLCCLLVAVILALLVPLEEKPSTTPASDEKIQESMLLETLLKSSHNIPRVVDLLEK